MKTILSYRVPLADPMAEITMPAGAVLLDAVRNVQRLGLDTYTVAVECARVWAVVDPAADKELRRFVVVQEGQAVQLSDNDHYVATVGTPDGARIWHLFDAGTAAAEVPS